MKLTSWLAVPSLPTIPKVFKSSPRGSRSRSCSKSPVPGEPTDLLGPVTSEGSGASSAISSKSVPETPPKRNRGYSMLRSPEGTGGYARRTLMRGISLRRNGQASTSKKEDKEAMAEREPAFTVTPPPMEESGQDRDAKDCERVLPVREPEEKAGGYRRKAGYGGLLQPPTAPKTRQRSPRTPRSDRRPVPIDEQTEVPADLYASLLKAAQEMEQSGQHVLVEAESYPASPAGSNSCRSASVSRMSNYSGSTNVSVSPRLVRKDCYCQASP